MIAHETHRLFTSSYARARFHMLPILLVMAFTIAYVGSRLYAMTHIPIFIDEAIHVDWARATSESLPAPAGFDGKWLTIKLFAAATALRLPVDDLIAARIVVVAICFSTALALFLLARELFSPRTGVLTVALYVLLPFTVIYNSIAMTDGIQMAFSTWAILLTVRLVRSAHWGYAITLPLVLASAILAKFSALVLIALPVLAIVLLTTRARWVKMLLLAAPALLTCLGLFMLFYQAGMLHVVQYKMISNSTGLKDRIWTNFMFAGNWLGGLLTPSIALLTLVAVLWLLIRERSRAGLFVVALLGLTVLPYIVVCETWYPRYMLNAVTPVALAVSQFVMSATTVVQTRWRRRRGFVTTIAYLSIAGLLSWPIVRSGAVLFALPQANIPALERYQLVTGWPSGYGVKELAAFLQMQNEITQGGINVARLHWWDHPLQSLNIYLLPSETILLYNLEHQNPDSVAALEWLSTKRRTLLVLRTGQGMPQAVPDEVAHLLRWNAPIWSYTRPGGISGLAVYELRVPSPTSGADTQTKR